MEKQKEIDYRPFIYLIFVEKKSGSTLCRSTRSMLLFDAQYSTADPLYRLNLVFLWGWIRGMRNSTEKISLPSKNRHYRHPFIMLIWLPPVVSERLHVPALSKLKTQKRSKYLPRIGLILSNKTSWRSSQWAYLLFIEYTPPLNRAVWVQLILFSAFTDSHWTSMPFKYPCHVQTG